jgi:serine/threonine protein kinase
MGGKIGDISNLKKGKRITVGSLSDLVIVRKIGEGGSAFVYTARTSSVLAPAPFSDSASVAGYSAAGSVSAHVHPDDDDGASVMSYAPGDASSLAPGRRRSRRSRLFSANRGFRHLSSSSLSSDLVVIKATSTSGSSTRKRQAEKEIEVLLRLRDKHHPNMVKIYDWASVKCSTTPNGSITLCAMEYCSGGSLMDLISDRRERLLAKRALRQEGNSPGLSTERDETSATNGNGNKFLRKLILGEEIPPPPPPPTPPPLLQSIGAAGNVGNAPTANQMSCEAYFDYEDILSIFQQVASALRFLHNSFDTQPLVHRDVKPENILLIPTNVNQRETIIRGMHRWTVRLCDYGSVVEGNVPLQSPADRKAAEDIIQKSTTQMYRAPEMVDVHSVQELTAK